MGFKTIVEANNEISCCYQRGLQALGANSGKVIAADTRKLNGSVFLDSCVSAKYPQDHRWDYIIGYKNEACFVEIHPASTSNISEMINKLKWLKSWLQTSAADLNSIKTKDSPFRWVSTGKVSILKDSPQSLRLAASGLSFPQKITELK